MEENQDAYGHLVQAFHQGEDVLEIIEREDGLIDFSAGPKAYFAEYNDWPEHNKEAMTFVHGRVLDIGCGPGRHSIYLQSQGFDVLGIDNSPLGIAVARIRGLKEARVLTITKISEELGIFDTIIMMGNNFGLFANHRRARWFLRRFHKITPHDGKIIAESNDPYKTSNLDHLAYHELNRNRGRMPGQLRIRVRFKKYKTPWFDYLMVSKDEMRDIIQGTGWFVKQFIESETSSYIAVIEKKRDLLIK